MFKKIQVTFLYAVLLGVIAYSQPVTRFAVIGDYGKASINEYNVSQMIRAWNPDFIITAGDNNYELGEQSTIDSNIGQYYYDFIYPYYGSFGPGAAFNKYFPSLGNHDWYTDSARAYLNYFTLPGNERYYDYVRSGIHFFVLDSDPNEPDGTSDTSIQAVWLHQHMSVAPEKIKIVYFHHPPYSSGLHGNNLYMQWPFRQWGATALLCGHDHDYERLDANGVALFINGVGGKDYRVFADTIPESRKQFTGDFGAQLVTAYNDSINFKFYTVSGLLVDDTTLQANPIGILPVSNEVPGGFSLEQNYPNPFNPETQIRFSIPLLRGVDANAPMVRGGRGVSISLTIYDALGREISVLVNEPLAPGKYEVTWNATEFASGIYFYLIISGDFRDTKKMVLVR